MDRHCSRNLQTITPDVLPPAQRDGAIRVLYFTLGKFGFKSWSDLRRAKVAERDDIDMLTVELENELWMKLLCAPIKPMLRYDLAPIRRRWVWRKRMERWLRGPLDARRFDVICTDTSIFAPAVGRTKQRLAGEHRIHQVINTDILPGNVFQLFEPPDPALPERSLPWHEQKLHEVEQRTWETADLGVSVTKWLRDIIVKTTHLRREETMVIPPMVKLPSAEQYEAARRTRRERAERGELPVLLFVGADFKRKGGDRLLRWHAEHFREKAVVQIISGGAPSSLDGPNMQLLGSVPNARVVGELMPAADAFVMPTMNDISPAVLIEAAAWGVPCISSNIGGIPE
ncbi:MAG: glycosyltransferase family 4 protein, partial [Planctomycetota bacterium]